MSTGAGKRQRTTLVKNKHDLLEGQHVIDITDERMARRRREDYETTLGHLSAIHRHEEPAQSGGLSRLLRRMSGRSKH